MYKRQQQRQTEREREYGVCYVRIAEAPALDAENVADKKPPAESWDGSASCNASDGELAAVGYSGSVQSFPILLGVFSYQQWAGAEDSEGVRHVAVTGNE